MEFRELCLTFTTSVILLSAKLGGGTSSNESRDATLRRWLHGCHMMFPCPPPPCDNPVYGQGDCCGHCPEPEPVPTSEKTLIKRPDESGANGTTALIEKNRRSLDLHGSSKELFKRLIYMTTPPFTRTTLPWTTPDCPYPCTHQGVDYCHPLPCYINCVDAVKPPGGCCYVCGNGMFIYLYTFIYMAYLFINLIEKTNFIHLHFT